ncbi:MAG: radical SAM protein [Elusimicrobia bacterium]|nr:radical SAM protein [Elusimicrobiota bacterium]
MSDPDIRITWNIHWSCNFRCSYCFFDGNWGEYGKRNVYKTVPEWMAVWRRVYAKYGRAYVTINGGEPFAYPNFIELIHQLSEIHWPINITTNTSLHLDQFVKRIDPKRVSLSVSFHPQYHVIEDTIKTVRFLRENKADLGCINFVAYPPFMPELPSYIEKLAAIGESLKVIPFVGTYRGIKYPDGYDAEQKKALGMKDDWIDGKRHKGMLCRAGHKSALLLPDGNVTRCGQIGDPGIFGNIFEADFSLLDKPTPCDVEFCPCDEWKVIPDEKAPEKAGAWLP